MGVASKYSKMVGKFTAYIPESIEFMKPKEAVEEYGIDKVYTVLKLFTTKGKFGDGATAIVTDSSSIFGINMPNHRVNEVKQMLSDPEVYAQSNDFKLGLQFYYYTSEDGIERISSHWIDL